MVKWLLSFSTGWLIAASLVATASAAPPAIKAVGGVASVARPDVALVRQELPNDTCAGVIDLQEQSLLQFQVDLCQATDTFSPGSFDVSCTGFPADGSDVVYEIFLTGGESFTVTVAGTHDVSIYLVQDCDDPSGSCVAGSDESLAGVPEQLSYVAAFAGTYYLVLDGYAGCGLVTVTVDSPVQARQSTWSAIRDLYGMAR